MESAALAAGSNAALCQSCRRGLAVIGAIRQKDPKPLEQRADKMEEGMC